MDVNALVITPTFNEKDNLPKLVERVLALPVKVDMLIVDDNSPDGTGKIADDLSAKHDRIHVMHRQVKNGLGRAYCDGFEWALKRDYDYILEMDGDFSHNPDDVPRFLEAAVKENADLVLGTRYKDGIRVINWPLRRLILSMGAGMYVRGITGMPISDPTGGYKCFHRRALESLDIAAIKSNGYSFQIELTHKIWRQGMRIAEVPIVFAERVHGCSKITGNIVVEAVWMVWSLYFQHGLRRWPRKPAPSPKETTPPPKNTETKPDAT